MPDRLKPRGWLAMISLFDPGAGMNQPSSGTPSCAGNVTSSYSRPCSDGEWKTGARRTQLNPFCEALQRLVELSLRGMDFVLNGRHRSLLSVAIEPSGARRSASDPR